MRKNSLMIVAFGILFLFFIQVAGTLVESIYILDLMNTRLDEKALGLLFFFTPVLLIFFPKKVPGWLVWLFCGLLVIARGLTPYLNTAERMLAAGTATGSALILLAILAGANPRGSDRRNSGLWISAGLALGLVFSVFLRTINFGLDYALTPPGGWAGWALGLVFVYLLSRLEWQEPPAAGKPAGGLTPAVFGILMILTLLYFAFSAPAVIARWTEGNYALIVTLVSLSGLGWLWVTLARPDLPARLPPLWLNIWNVLFSLALTGTILAHTITFPAAPDSPAVIVGAPTWYQQIPLVLMLLLFPVIFIDARLLAQRFEQGVPAPRAFVPGLLGGTLALVLLTFMHIFTNVWAYVEPVSPFFRNKFWLPYLLPAAAITLLAARGGRLAADAGQTPRRLIPLGWAAGLGLIFLLTETAALWPLTLAPVDQTKSTLLVMTINMQQANDKYAEHSYDRQLALMRKVSPDILALQESDSARISLNNNDYVRYYAARLGYYSYYGPKTVSGTFGTAILSRYPLRDTQTVFTFSDGDEIGTAEAKIEVAGRTISIFDVHPDGSDTAMLAFAKNLLERSRGQGDVIALGDYNLRDYEEAYQLIASELTNAWVSVYPAKISPDGVDMSGDNRIDHIFISKSLVASQPVYLLPPASATDHPVHWATISWAK